VLTDKHDRGNGFAPIARSFRPDQGELERKPSRIWPKLTLPGADLNNPFRSFKSKVASVAVLVTGGDTHAARLREPRRRDALGLELCDDVTLRPDAIPPLSGKRITTAA
jgi:hypothetical protein